MRIRRIGIRTVTLVTHRQSCVKLDQHRETAGIGLRFAKPEAIAGARQRRVLTVLDGGGGACLLTLKRLDRQSFQTAFVPVIHRRFEGFYYPATTQNRDRVRAGNGA